MANNVLNFPRQMMSFKSKNKTWRMNHLKWAASKTFFNYSPVRNTVAKKKIAYDLVNGILHSSDMEMVLNPDHIDAGYIPESIQHYPIINSKLHVLRGEERKRPFDFRVIVTNPNSISEIEESKKNALLTDLQNLVANTAQSEEEFNQELEKLNEYYTYQWQDFREIRANALLNHYIKEYNIPLLFNKGFMDAMIVGEEIYQCDIINGEPTIEKLDPLQVRIFRSGTSDKIEDADVIILEDYWSPGRIIDTFHEQLTKKDIEYLENNSNFVDGSTDEMGNIDERNGFINTHMVSDIITTSTDINTNELFGNEETYSLAPFDTNGNVRVVRMYWKSKRAILKVKSYNLITGEEEYNFYPETYVPNEYMGEEAQKLWINEAWEGTLIGDVNHGIYVNMRPRLVQYNRLSNPSECHFGIIGSIYSLNHSKPYSLVDIMKPYSYFYDAMHDRLNKSIASNWGSILELDLSKVPSGWDMDKWMYYAKVNHLAVVNSFNEGTVGAATGKLAGAMNNASRGIIETNLGNYIQYLINLLEFTKLEMSEVAGISKQREGQISNRETVGGVERATLQSSHITEWLFSIHDDVKKRVLECFLETAKIASRGKNIKFQYILGDTSQRIMEFEGDEFAESDYGLVVDNSPGIQDLQSKLDMLAQAALQTQTLSFSTITKLYSSASLAEKQRLIENDEMKIKQMQQQQQQQQLESQQQIAQMQQQAQMAEMQQKDAINQRDNETKILVAQINAQAKVIDDLDDGINPDEYSQEAKDKLAEQIRQFNEKMKLDRDKFNFDKESKKEELRLKEKQINKKSVSK